MMSLVAADFNSQQLYFIQLENKSIFAFIVDSERKKTKSRTENWMVCLMQNFFLRQLEAKVIIRALRCIFMSIRSVDGEGLEKDLQCTT